MDSVQEIALLNQIRKQLIWPKDAGGLAQAELSTIMGVHRG
jgi:hypothetical protein